MHVKQSESHRRHLWRHASLTLWSTEECAASKVKPCSFNAAPPAAASFLPDSESAASNQPQNWLRAFHSDSPCRHMTMVTVSAAVVKWRGAGERERETVAVPDVNTYLLFCGIEESGVRTSERHCDTARTHAGMAAFGANIYTCSFIIIIYSVETPNNTFPIDMVQQG